MDIATLHETGDTETLEELRRLLDSASTRAERDVVQLAVDVLGPRPGVALGSLRLLVDEYVPWLERRIVNRAREQGTSWAGIARLLRCSRQAAHKKFSHPLSVGELLPPPPLHRADPDSTDRRSAGEQHRRQHEADGADLDGDLVAW